MERFSELSNSVSTPPNVVVASGHSGFIVGQAATVTSPAITFGRQRREKVVAVIPAYKEDRFIGSVVLKTRPHVDHVIVVDDGSPDQTASIAAEAGADVIVLAVNQGKAKALATGFERALDLDADVVVILDADGQHNPAEIPGVIRPILDGKADMVIGSRFQGTKSKIPVWRQFGQHGLTLVTNVASGVTSTDSQSGFRAFRREALATFNISARGFSVESEMQFWAREQALRIVEAPISVVYAEKPKRSPIGQGLQVLNGVVQLVSQMRPLLFFGLTGLLITLLGIGFWYNIVRTYNLTQQFALGHALLATLFITVGMLSAFEGLTLHILRQLVRGPNARRLGRFSVPAPVEEKGELAAVRVNTGSAQPARRRVRN